MYSESVCQVARSWVDVGSFHKGLVVRFMKFTASVRNVLDTSSYIERFFRKYRLSSKRSTLGPRFNELNLFLEAVREPKCL
jgi:hypothetical protein